MKKVMGKVCIGLLIIVLLLTGCGTGSGNGNETTKTATTTTTGAKTATSTAASTQETTEAMREQAKPVTIMYTEARESNQADVDATKKYMEEQSGVKFEVKKIAVAADFISSVNLSLASNEDIDVILVQSNDHFQSLVQRGALQVINEPLEKYGPNLRKIYTEDAWKSVSDKEGNILGIPRQSAPFGSLIANRKDWREKLGFNPITSI